jgi:hypothetical protein
MWKSNTLAGRAVWAHGERLYDAVDKLRVEDVKRLLGAGMDPNSTYFISRHHCSALH